MSIEGWYYLHVNGDLIYKRNFDGQVADFRESDLVRMFWPFDHTEREGCWRILIEASALGARKSRIERLVEHWQCNDDDAKVYAERIGVLLSVDGNQKCATKQDFVNLQESPAGFGTSNLDAMADLAKQLGFQASKMWGPSFMDLVKAKQAV